MSFNTGLSGLNAASRNLDVIGHNIANANTTGMKAGRAEFAELYASSIGASGGNAGGIGVEVAAVSQLFTQGNISITGNDLDLAINGNGFFNVTQTNGDVAYTRNGAFKLDKDGFLVTNSGAQLNGFQVDPATGAVLRGSQPSPLQLPTAKGLPAKLTTDIVAGLNLDARADIATETVPPVAPATVGTFDPPIETYGTSVVVYDTQGVEVPVNLFFVKNALNEWNVYAQPEGAETTQIGSVTFDSKGVIDPASLASLTPIAVPTTSLPPVSVGPPVQLATFDVTLDLSEVTQYGTRFSVYQLEQDGYAPGELTGLSIEENGEVLARYSNGESVLSGQVALTTFRNLQGLQPLSGGYWARTLESGEPVTSVPRDPGFGSVRQGALEESNVDITAELVNMITAQRSYQANAQTIKTQDQVLSTLVNLR
jgi:flagellar hook protein FlgE